MRSFRRVAIPGLVIFLIGFGAYLVHLYGQLEVAFGQRDQFVPTRIYSDVTRIAAPAKRWQIEDRLRALGYKSETDATTLRFTIRPVDYPNYLLPDGHPLLDPPDRTVSLQFEGTGRNSTLKSLQLGGKDVPDIYLEPELVATLSPSDERRNEIRAIMPFAEIPAPVWKAIIAVEDQHFLEHKGFDPKGIARAVWVDLKTHSLSQGGSTITQQLVKNLMARHSKNFFKKINELFLALLLEAKYDKEKILERYLNEVYLGQVGSLEIHGVVEGAQHFFGKKLDELNLAEIALMAGFIRGPGYYSPYRYFDRSIERQHWVLKKMVETGQIAQEEADAALQMPIRLAPPRTSQNKAPYFVDFVKAELIRLLKDRMTETEITSAGFRVYTTLDMAMNTEAQRSIADGIARLEKNLKLKPADRLEGALAAVDQSTGYVRALVGGRSYAESTFNRILNMKRQVGSTFKPFVYLTALEKGEDPNGIAYGPGHPIEDAPWTLHYDHRRQTWSPRNYEPEFLGWTTYRHALAHSVNTAAAKLGVEIGIENIVKTAKTLGIESPLPLVPSLSLGVAELSPVELLRAYATIANHGIRDDLTVIRGITHDNGQGYARFVYNPEQVYPAGPADLLTDMLTSVFTEGTAVSARALGFFRPAAGKTGTTSNYRDSWFAGYTPEMTTVVWVGMDHPTSESVGHLTGATSALPIWVSFMNQALAGAPATPFPFSDSLVQVRVDPKTGRAASLFCSDTKAVIEKYIKRHEPGGSSCEDTFPPSVPEAEM